MRVTSSIRDFISGEISAKYDAKLRAQFSGYEAKKEVLRAEIEAIAAEANEKALAACAAAGFTPELGRYNRSLICVNNTPCDAETERKIGNMRSEYMLRARRHTDQVRFDLEIGDAKKDEIRAIIDAIEV